MREVVDRIEAGVLAGGGRQHMRRHAGAHQRVAVRIGARDALRADDAAGAGAVLDDELLAEDRAQDRPRTAAR